MEDRERRIAQNEALYRSINERIEDLNHAFGTLTGAMTVVCECGDASCVEQIHVDVGTYERVRSSAKLFIIVPGHEVDDVEELVEETPEFAIVAKREGKAAEIAVETDPRA